MKKLSKKQRTFKLLTHSARVLFEENGVENVTFDDIADHANVCRTTVFNHFPSGKDLLVAICNVEVNELINHCAESSLQGLDLIKSLFGKLIDDTCLYPTVMTQLTTTYISQKGVAEGAVSLVKAVEENLLLEHRSNPLKILEKLQAEDAGTLIFGTYFGLVSRSHIFDRAFDAAGMKENFYDILDKIVF